jgi:hypothetical protein
VRALFFLFVLTFACSLPAQSHHASAAFRARELLGHDTWSKVLRIENSNPESAYPRVVYALVFEFADILWFYTAIDGTQSFSLYRNRLEQEKANLSPGLLAIDPGFRRFTELRSAPAELNQLRALPNGCFVTSVVAGWKELARGEPILNAQLLMFYVRGRDAGHCVFLYETPRGVYSIDAQEDGVPRKLGGAFTAAPRELAVAVANLSSPKQLRAVRTLKFPTSPVSSDSLLAQSKKAAGADIARVN